MITLSVFLVIAIAVYVGVSLNREVRFALKKAMLGWLPKGTPSIGFLGEHIATLWDNGVAKNWIKITVLGIVAALVASQLPNTPFRITSTPQIPIFILLCVGLGIGHITAPWEGNWVRRGLVLILWCEFAIHFTYYFFPDVAETIRAWVVAKHRVAHTEEEIPGYVILGWALVIILVGWLLARSKKVNGGWLGRAAFKLAAAVVLLWAADRWVFPNFIRTPTRVAARVSRAPTTPYQPPVITDPARELDLSRVGWCSRKEYHRVARETRVGLVVSYTCWARPGKLMGGLYIGYSDHRPEVKFVEGGGSGEIAARVFGSEGNKIAQASPGELPFGHWLSLQFIGAEKSRLIRVDIHKDSDRWPRRAES